MTSKGKILTLMGLFLAFELLYQGLLYVEKIFFPTSPFMIVALSSVLGVFLVAYVIINRGFNTPVRSDHPLPEQRAREQERAAQRRKKTEFMLYIIIPLSLVLTVDLVTLFLF